MSLSAISSSTAQPAWSKALDAPLGMTAPARSSAGKPPTPEEIKKAASQFEAIILRQLLAPTIEPMMSGGLGGEGGSAGGGGGVYGYLLTDVLASSLSKGGGLGLSQMLARQLTPRGEALSDEAGTDTHTTVNPS